MRILFVVPRYYPFIGGVEYVVKSLAERLAKMGHEVVVLCGEPGIDKLVEEEIEKVHVIRWPTWAPNNAYHVPRRREDLDRFLAKLVREVDVVHIHSAHAVLPIYVALKAKDISPTTRLIATLHYHAGGHTFLRDLLWKLGWRRMVSKALLRADKVHAVSQYEAETIKKHYPHVAPKLVVIPNGVDEDVFQYKWRGRDSDYMIYAGRIERYKRLELAIELARKLGLRLVIVGEGSYKKTLAKYAEKHYPGRAGFKPPQPRHKYLKLLANARYAVNPSTREAYSIFIAEALAIGTPSYVSKTIAQILSNRNYAKKGVENLILLRNTSTENIVKPWSLIVHKILYEYIS
jgi:glycosyltransferase involved in cell wall biosynthesis